MPPPKEDGIRHPPKKGGTPPGTPPARGGRDQRMVRVDRTGFDTVLGSDGAAAADVFRGFEGHDLAELYVLPRRCLDPEKLKGFPHDQLRRKTDLFLLNQLFFICSSTCLLLLLEELALLVQILQVFSRNRHHCSYDSGREHTLQCVENGVHSAAPCSTMFGDRAER